MSVRPEIVERRWTENELEHTSTVWQLFCVSLNDKEEPVNLYPFDFHEDLIIQKLKRYLLNLSPTTQKLCKHNSDNLKGLED